MVTVATTATVADYILEAARSRGIDPQTALKGFLAENPSLNPHAVGDNGSSFNITQLHYGGLAKGGNSGPGLGDEFTKETGLLAQDPNNWKAVVDWSLDRAKRDGWGAWHAFAKVGIGVWDGIRGSLGAIINGFNYVFPVDGYKGNPSDTYHTPGGSDLFAPLGTAVRNMVAGVVKSVGLNSGPGGNWVLIQGDDGLEYYYAHLNGSPLVQRGQKVNAGDQLGEVGKSGNASGTDPHLHIGIGKGINTGTGSDGGVGINFDAQAFLKQLLGLGVVNPVQTAVNASVGGGVKAGIDYVFQRIRELIDGWVASVRQYWIGEATNRAFYIVGALLIVAGVLALANAGAQQAQSNPVVRAVVTRAAV